MPFDGQARWQIDILAADRTAAAFSSVDRRMRTSQEGMRRLTEQAAAMARTQAVGFARLSAATPSNQAAGYARLAGETARQESVARATRLAETAGASLAAMYGVQTTGASKLARANDAVAVSLHAFGRTKVAATSFAEIDRQMGAVTQQGPRLAASIAGSAGAMGGLLGVVGRFAPALSLAGAAFAVWNAGMKAGGMIDQAEQLGLTTTAMQAYHLVALQSGVGTEQFDGAVQRLTASMGAAKDGSDQAIERFDRLGVKLLDSNKQLRPLGDVLPEVARGLMRVGSETERNAIAQELFGRGGARLVTMLSSMAQGTDALTAAAAKNGTLVSRETSDAWNKLDAQLKIAKTAADSALAALAAPIATVAMEAVNRILSDILANLDRLKREAATAPQRAVQADTGQLKDQLAAARQRQAQFPEGSTGYKLEAGGIKGLEDRLAATRRTAIALDVAADVAGNNNGPGPDPAPPLPGAIQPTGTKAGTAGQKLDERLKELQVERRALETALASFDVRGNETVAEADKRLDAQVKLDKKIFDVLKDVPPNSPLAQQLTQEATAISQFSQRLDEKKRLLTEAEQVTGQYGDGTRVAARATEDLNRMLAMGAIDQGTYNAALKAVTQQADDAARAYRGAAGGADGFMAGIEQGMADLERANSAFEVGKQVVDQLSDAFTDLAMGAEVDFNRILQSFLSMLIQMEMRAAVSSLFKAVGGDSGGGSALGGLGGLVTGAIGSLVGAFGGGAWNIGAVGGAYNGGGSASYGGPRAAGGAVDPSRWYMVGEQGPETFVPQTAGTILPFGAQQGGGETTVIVQQTVHVGEYVTSTEFRRGLGAVKDAAQQGAMAAILDDRRRGGKSKRVFG